MATKTIKKWIGDSPFILSIDTYDLYSSKTDKSNTNLELALRMPHGCSFYLNYDASFDCKKSLVEAQQLRDLVLKYIDLIEQNMKQKEKKK